MWACTPAGTEAAAAAGPPGEAHQVRELRPEYQVSPRPQLRPSILTPMQETFLRRFFVFDVGQRFFLTGGTAAAFYLGHRLSEDLDLFTLSDEAFGKLEAELGRWPRDAVENGHNPDISCFAASRFRKPGRRGAAG